MIDTQYCPHCKRPVGAIGTVRPDRCYGDCKRHPFLGPEFASALTEAGHSLTVLKAMVVMATKMFPEGHPERLFVEWLAEHHGNLPQGCRDLGVEPPPLGPRLLPRIKEWLCRH